MSSPDDDLTAVGDAVNHVLKKYHLPFEAIGELFEIATLTAKWQATACLAKLVGAPESSSTPRGGALPLN